MAKSFIPGTILAAAIAAALVNQAFGGAWTLSLLLFAVAGAPLLVVLAMAYQFGARLDHRIGAHRFRGIRAHVILHVVPLTYFLLAHGIGHGNSLDTIYLVPVCFFFFTGMRTWRACHERFGRKLYMIFKIGNAQMLVLFPAALVLELIGWTAAGDTPFFTLMHGYFVVHFMLAGLAVPLLGRDLRR